MTSAVYEASWLVSFGLASVTYPIFFTCFRRPEAPPLARTGSTSSVSPSSGPDDVTTTMHMLLRPHVPSAPTPRCDVQYLSGGHYFSPAREETKAESLPYAHVVSLY